MPSRVHSQMRLPEFIVGGAPRCGTTWLYRLLERHPGVHMAAPVRPEPKFFLVDDLYARGLEWYSAQWFEAAAPGRICGEKSANYLESAIAARRIARDLPGVRLVFLLRNPVERAWSNYRWSRMNGIETETFERALALEEQRDRNLAAEHRFSRPHAYFSRGLYAKLLRPWLEAFPSESILCLRSEDLSERPDPLVERLHRFLGLPVRARDADGLGVINAAGPAAKELLAVETRCMLEERYAEPNRELAKILGPNFEVWPHGCHAAPV